MPRLPAIQPGPGGGPPSVPPNAFGKGIGDALKSFGDNLGEVATHLLHQQDEIDLAKMTGEYDFRLADAQMKLKEDPEYLTHPNKFIEAENQIRKEVLKMSGRVPVQTAFASHIARKFPSDLISVKAEALNLWNRKQAADIGNLSENMLADVARATSDEQRKESIATYEGIVNNAEKRGILPPVEAEHLRKAFRQQAQFGAALQDARIDPIGTFENLATKYPLLDAKHMEAVISRTMAQNAKIEHEADKRMKEVRNNAVLEDFISAANGQLSREQLEKNARRFGYSDEDFSKVRSEMERGGTTIPNVLLNLETSIRTGNPPDPRVIVGRSDLSMADKIRLLTLIDEVNQRNQEKKGDHFSKSPEYEQAFKEMKNAITRKGLMETLDPQEQKLFDIGIRQLWNRTAKGEDPITVAREFIARIPNEEGGFGIIAPILAPKFESEEKLLQAFKEGKISKAEAEQEAKNFERIRKEEANRKKSQDKLKERQK